MCVSFCALRVGVDDVLQALSEFLRSITCLPSDITLLSLPPGPLLGLICVASQRQLTAVWLTLANMLIIQLDPPIMFTTMTLKTPPNVEGMTVVSNVLPVLLQTSLSMLGQPGAMESVRVWVQIASMGADTTSEPRYRAGVLWLFGQCACLSGRTFVYIKAVRRWPSTLWRYSTTSHRVPWMP